MAFVAVIVGGNVPRVAAVGAAIRHGNGTSKVDGGGGFVAAPGVCGVNPEVALYFLKQACLHALSVDTKLLEKFRPDRERPLVGVADVDLRMGRQLDPALFLRTVRPERRRRGVGKC